MMFRKCLKKSRDNEATPLLQQGSINTQNKSTFSLRHLSFDRRSKFQKHKEQQKDSHLVNLPDEMILLIIAYLDFQTNGRLAQTCKIMCKLVYQHEYPMEPKLTHQFLNDHFNEIKKRSANLTVNRLHEGLPALPSSCAVLTTGCLCAATITVGTIVVAIYAIETTLAATSGIRCLADTGSALGICSTCITTGTTITIGAARYVDKIEEKNKDEIKKLEHEMNDYPARIVMKK